MIQDILPYSLDNSFKHVDPKESNYVFTFRGTKPLFIMGGDNVKIPTFGDLPGGFDKYKDKAIYLFSIDDEPIYLILARDFEDEPAPDMKFYFLQKVYGINSGWVPLAAFTANHLNHWYEEHHFCGCCGAITDFSEKERAKICPKCGNIQYPRISPVVMAAVTDGDRLLVTRYTGRSYKGIALIAGFVEIGETLEEAVKREVMEEVNLKVKGLRYYGSQPWGLSDSLIAGFFVYLDGTDEFKIDETELEKAAWLTRDELPQLVDNVSITAAMIEDFRTGKY